MNMTGDLKNKVLYMYMVNQPKLKLSYTYYII